MEMRCVQTAIVLRLLSVSSCFLNVPGFRPIWAPVVSSPPMLRNSRNEAFTTQLIPIGGDMLAVELFGRSRTRSYIFEAILSYF